MTAIPENLKSLKHFLAIRDIDGEVLKSLVNFAIQRKTEFRSGQFKPMLAGKVLTMVFQKASLRTRLAFETAMVQLGGHAINLDDHQVGLAKREEVRDIARVIASMSDGIMARVFGHQLVVELGAYSSVPVINGLSDWEHPCQALADIMTIQEHFGRLSDLKVAYVGDANNVARSLCNACVRTGASFAIASPAGYQMDDGVVQSAAALGAGSGAEVLATDDPGKAVRDADVIYTDVWASMGQESETAARAKAFANFQVNAELLRQAKVTAIVMHCLPAHRNQEITDEVMDSPQSRVFEQAENRMHSQRALLEVLMSRPVKTRA